MQVNGSLGRLIRQAALIVCIGLLVTPAASVRADAAASRPADKDRILHRLQILTSPSLAGRGSGSAGAAVAADTLATWLTKLGLQPAFAGSWYQEVPLTGTGWTGNDLSGRFDRNVAGILPGTGNLARRYVIVGAHYDHLGRLAVAGDDASPPEPGQYYPGANDNASGVAVLLELAELLGTATAGDDSARRSVLLVAFAAEEVGLQGSRHLVANLPVPRDSIDVMVNFDTVGQLQNDRLYVSGVGTAAQLPDLVRRANTESLELSLAQGGWSGSDHMVFNTAEIPVLFLFSGPYPEYNRPTDDWPTVNVDGLAKISRYAARLVDALRCETRALDWVMVAGKDLRPVADNEQNRDTWFGSMPDFTEAVTGYKLAGVFDGSPAARAGLQKGDVLVRLAGAEITDLASFTVALRKHAPGDLVEITVRRDGKALNFTVVLGSRQDRR